MATQLIQYRVQVRAKRPRRAWLESPSPGYGETLAWLVRQRTPPEPANFPDDNGGVRFANWRAPLGPYIWSVTTAWLQLIVPAVTQTTWTAKLSSDYPLASWLDVTGHNPTVDSSDYTILIWGPPATIHAILADAAYRLTAKPYQ